MKINKSQPSGAALKTAASEAFNDLRIAHLQNKVGDGISYSNSVGRITISERGCYFTLEAFPAEFAGGLGEDAHLSRLSADEAMDLIAALLSIGQNAANQEQRITELSIYSLTAHSNMYKRKELFCADLQENGWNVLFGDGDPRMAIVAKARIDADEAVCKRLGLKGKGTVVLLKPDHMDDGQWICLRIDRRGE